MSSAPNLDTLPCPDDEVTLAEYVPPDLTTICRSLTEAMGMGGRDPPSHERVETASGPGSLVAILLQAAVAFGMEHAPAAFTG